VNRKELENMAREALVVAAWAIHRLPINTWPDWVVLLTDLIGAQDNSTNDIENVLIELRSRIEERLCRGQW